MAQNIHAHNPDNSPGLEETSYINGFSSSARQDNIEQSDHQLNGNGEINDETEDVLDSLKKQHDGSTKTASAQDVRNLPSATQVISSNNLSSSETTAKSYNQNGANLNLQHTQDDSQTHETNLETSPKLTLSNDFYGDKDRSTPVNDDISNDNDKESNDNKSSNSLINNIANDLAKKPQLRQPTIINVYKGNLSQEFGKIRNLITKEKYTYVAMDTEFPGIAFNPENYTRDTDLRDRKYHDIKVNVDSLKIIQIGLCFFNKDGEMPPNSATWQFHFEFNQNKDMINEDSLQMLKKAGIDFEKLSTDGICTYEFAHYLTTSGLCLNKKISWITYHSGFDFLYMMRLFRDDHVLPDDFEKLNKYLHIVFPNLYDVKHLCKKLNVPRYEKGLADLADSLGVERYGEAHQAGSDALMTGETFFRLRDNYLETDFKGEGYRNIIFGIGEGITDEDKAHFRAMKNRFYEQRFNNNTNTNNNVPSEQNSANSDQRLFTRISQSSQSLQLNNNQYSANNMTPPPSAEKLTDQNNNSLINSIESIKRAAIS